MTDNQEELVRQLNLLLEKPGGRQAIRFVLNAMGGIPFVGGAIAASGAMWSEKEQQNFNQKITEWVTQTEQDLGRVIELLADQLHEPTKAHLVILIGEVTGVDTSEQLLPVQIPVILNGETISEFQPFVSRGWITLTPNHNVTNMGAGNRIGNSIEDRKRPWGMGNGFILTVSRLSEETNPG